MSNIKTIGDIGRRFVLLGPVEPLMLECRRHECKKAYPGYKRGCPNYGKRPDCPPLAPHFADLYHGQVRIVACVFDFAQYFRWRQSLRSTWTAKALRNPRHWQGHLRSAMNKHLKTMTLKDDEEFILNPEAQGIDVTATCAAAGLQLEWPPINNVCRVAMIAKRA